MQRNAPSPAKVEKLLEGGRDGGRGGAGDDYNAAAVRASLRVFFATAAGLKAWGAVKERVLGGGVVRFVYSISGFAV